MNNKINIIQFMPYFPPHKGGLETHAEQWGKWWVKKDSGEVINVITSFDQSVLLGDQIVFEGKTIGYKKDGVENLIVPSFEVIPNFPIYKVWSNKYKLIIKYLNNKNIDIVITRTRFFLTSFIGGIFARKNNLKWCHIEHGSNYVKLNSSLKNFVAKIYDKIIGKWIFKKADKLVGVSEACKKFINEEFVRRSVEVIYRGVELINLDKQKSLELKLVFIGRLVKLKGIEDLLNAYSKLKTNISLDIIGDGEELQILENIVSKNKIKNVEFLGFKNKEFITDYLSKNKCIFVNTSYQEGLPTSVIEGLFYNNVVVASDVGGTREISKEDDLVLFEAGNIDGLVEKIESTIEEYDSLVGKSKKIIVDNFDWKKNIEKYYKLFN